MARKKAAPEADKQENTRKSARCAGKADAGNLSGARNAADGPQGTPGNEGRRSQIGYTLVGIALIAIVAAFGYLSTGSIS